jgi:hypothetical protein
MNQVHGLLLSFNDWHVYACGVAWRDAQTNALILAAM